MAVKASSLGVTVETDQRLQGCWEKNSGVGSTHWRHVTDVREGEWDPDAAFRCSSLKILENVIEKKDFSKLFGFDMKMGGWTSQIHFHFIKESLLVD